MGKSPFLEGNFAPVERELEADDLAVVGTLPPELAGTYVRTGPNPQLPPDGQYHWFDGDGMLHAVRFAGGRASYRNRWVRTRGFELERARGRPQWTGLLERRQFDNPEGAVKNTANAGLACFAGKLLALHDQGEPYEIALPGLETRGAFTANRRLRHPLAPHPKLDPATGELYAVGYSPIAKPHLQYSIFAADGALVHTTAVELPIGVLVHDFALTERFAVFMNHPYTYDVRRWLRGEPIARFEPERGSFIGLLPRRASGSEVRWYPVAPCFVYHTVNAWDDGEQVVLDVFHRWALDLASDLEPRPAPDQLSQLWRWRINPRGGGVREEPLDERNADLPSVHPSRLGKRARWAFASRLRSDVRQPIADALLKYDLHGPADPAIHSFGADRVGGEGLFVPRPGAEAEDDGWLLAFVHDEKEGASELLVLDARDLAEPPVARVQLPQRVPFGLHGVFSPDVR